MSVSVPFAPLAADEFAEMDLRVDSLRRFGVEEYHALIDAGCFAEDEDYELLEGLLVHKMGKKRAHTLATQRLRELLETMLTGYYVHSQEPIMTGDSEPEPDVSVVRGRPEDYTTQPPAAAVPMVIEVADQTLRRDRNWKKRIYARAGIPVYWIVNVVDQQVEVYTQPSGATAKPDYKGCEIIGAAGKVPVSIEGREVGRIQVHEILP